MSMIPQEVQELLDELEASRASRRRAWENLQEIRWVFKDAAKDGSIAAGLVSFNSSRVGTSERSACLFPNYVGRAHSFPNSEKHRVP
jgi:hypothetical protein